jgi:hypothetical protein
VKLPVLSGDDRERKGKIEGEIRVLIESLKQTAVHEGVS